LFLLYGSRSSGKLNIFYRDLRYLEGHLGRPVHPLRHAEAPGMATRAVGSHGRQGHEDRIPGHGPAAVPGSGPSPEKGSRSGRRVAHRMVGEGTGDVADRGGRMSMSSF